MYIALLNLPNAAEKHDLKAIASTLRLGASGGAAMPVEVMTAFESRFGVTILEGYGLSETSPIATFSYLELDRIAGCVGKAVPGTDVRIVDEAGAEVPTGNAGRDRDSRPQHHEGLLQPPGGDRRGDPRRLVPFRRHRPHGREGQRLRGRSLEGHDHPRRLQRLPARARGGDDGARGDRPGRRGRRAARDARRRSQGRGRAEARARAHRPRPSARGARSGWRATSTRASSTSSKRCR